jgi:hypothetical protein
MRTSGDDRLVAEAGEEPSQPMDREAFRLRRCRIPAQEGEGDRTVETAEQLGRCRVVGLEHGPELMLQTTVLDDEPLAVTDERPELSLVGTRPAERPPRGDLAAKQIGQGERVERVALHRSGAIALPGPGGDLRVDRVDGMAPREEVVDKQALPPLDRDADLGWLAESGQRDAKPLQPGAIVRHPQREGRPVPTIEGMDLVMLLAPIDPDEDLHDAALLAATPRLAARRTHPGRSSFGARDTSPSGRCRLAFRAEARVCRRISKPIAAAKALSARCETRTSGPGPLCTDERCQVAPRSCSWTALTRPRWLSLMTRRTPSRPRSTSERMNAGQALPSSLPGLSSRPRIRRSPEVATPLATRAAIETTRPPSRTLT